jgi:CheY-like chemotaxis protein
MHKKRIFMVVDDDSDDRELFAEAVEELFPGAACLTASNGEHALKTLRSESVDLPEYIFLDLNMPIMDGKECLTELKKDESLSQVPVVIFSTSSTKKDIDETTALGAVYFLTKPTSFNKLCDEILKVTEQ